MRTMFGLAVVLLAGCPATKDSGAASPTTGSEAGTGSGTGTGTGSGTGTGTGAGTGTGTGTGSSFPNVTGGDSTTAQFGLTWDGLADADADGAWEVGELATLTVVMQNNGADDFNYPGCVLTTTSDVGIDLAEFSFFGIPAGESNTCSWQLTPGAGATAGTVVTLEAIAHRLHCTGDCPEENTLTMQFQIVAPN